MLILLRAGGRVAVVVAVVAVVLGGGLLLQTEKLCILPENVLEFLLSWKQTLALGNGGVDAIER